MDSVSPIVISSYNQIDTKPPMFLCSGAVSYVNLVMVESYRSSLGTTQPQPWA